VNGVLDARTAEALKNLSAEVVVAVGFTPEAMNVLQFERSLILLEMPDIRSKVQFTFHLQKIYGGLLMQTYDTFTYENARCVTERAPTANERKALDFNYKVAKHARSSAVVIGKDGVTAGIGTGQTNRTLALKAALSIAGKGAAGCVAVSDFRFPTLECVELCHAAGITAIMQTGESPLDEEMIELCNKYRIAMLFTGARHFKN
jgi:phosphoribosylaminoimidazolecarboxamide formyltransferase/IMP cyclohydrolase